MAEGVFTRRRVGGSAVWATIQQAAVLGSTAVIGIVLANYLPLEDFGIFAFVTTLASMGMVIVTAGLNALAVKLLVNDDAQQGRVLANLLLLRELCAAVAYIVLGVVAYVSAESSTLPVALLSLTVLFARAADFGEYWFQAEARAGAVAPVRVTVLIVSLAVRVTAAVAGAPLVVHVALYVVESVVVSIAVITRFAFVSGRPRVAGATPRGAAAMLGMSWLLLLAGFAAQINSRADIILINAIDGSTAVGIYAAAARLSELAYFLPVVFMTATFPRLLQVRRSFGRTSSEYKSELQRGYDGAFWLGILVAASLWLVGGPLVDVLFGQEFEGATPVLRIHVIALPAVFMAAVLSKWMVAEGLYGASLARNAIGAAVNIGLNAFLIPKYGIEGAALATVISYITASYLVCWAYPPLRPAAIQMSRAFFAPISLLHRRLKGKNR